MMNAIEVTLLGGVAVDGNWHRAAWLRPLSGQDEAFLIEEARFFTPARRVTTLLARALERLGPLAPVTQEAVSALTVGDRDALLLQLRRLTLGERIACVLSCPRASCGEKMDLDLEVSDLLLPPYPHEEATHERVVADEDGRQYRVRFRLPTGADQEAAAMPARDNVEAAARLILRRCIESVEVEKAAQYAGEDLPPAVARAVSQWMAELDPQAELRLNLMCPVCSTSFTVEFDVGNFLFQELAGTRDDFYREVHLLALHYHWSEADVLALTRQKRRLYLGLLAETLNARRAA